MIHQYDWGEPVKVVDNAPEKYLEVGKGSICGMRRIVSEIVAADFGEPIGTVLYLVEGSTGEAVEIPERFLVAL